MPKRGRRSAGLGVRHPNKKIKCYRNRPSNRANINDNNNSLNLQPCLNKNPARTGGKDPPPSDLFDNDGNILGIYLPDKEMSKDRFKVCRLYQK